MLFHGRDKGKPSQRNRLNPAAKVTGPGPEREDTDNYTIPITYPDGRYSKMKAVMLSDESVEEARDQADFNMR